jgi:two-component system, chemotaxis family, chemotaxis protein CheY
MTVPLEYLNSLILIVDDEAPMRRTIGNMLSRMGFGSLLYAENGAAANSYIQNSAVDLIICDIIMPEMNGMELFRLVRSNKKIGDMSFIFVTAEARRNVVARAAEDGGGGYIIKPFVMTTLEEKIIEVLRRKIHPTPVEKHINKYRQHMDSFNIQAAEEEIQEALCDDPESPALFFYMGQISVHKGLPDRAANYFRAAIERKPLFVKAYDALGKLYEDQGDALLAVENYETANRISSSNADRLVTLSKLYVKTDEPEKAMALLKDASGELNHDPSMSEHLLGELYMANGEYEKALAAFRAANRRNPSDFAVMKSLAEAYRKNSKPGHALEIYRQILFLTPHNADIYHFIGKTYLEMGEKDAAIEAITKAWEINPASKEITRDLRALAEKQKIEL